MGRIIPYMKWTNKSHVPNHQPDMLNPTPVTTNFGGTPSHLWQDLGWLLAVGSPYYPLVNIQKLWENTILNGTIN